MFDHKGVIRFDREVASDDDIFDEAVTFGADSVESEDDLHEVQTELQSFTEIRDNLIAKYGDPVSASLEWIAQNDVDIDPDKSSTMLKLIDALEEDDDVQNFYTNAEIPKDE